MGLKLSSRPAQEWRLERADEGISWSPARGFAPPASLAFAWAALEELLVDFPDLPPHRLRFFAPAIGVGERKPGVGGSASACVVTAAGLLAANNVSISAADLTALALRAHHRAQGKLGSGYDVATIAHGGLIEWAPGVREGHEARALRGIARPLNWPRDLSLLAGYSGQSADTRAFLQRLRQQPAAAQQGVESLAEPTQALIHAIECAPASIASCVRSAHQALCKWDGELGLGIVTPRLREIIAAAAKIGAAAKVSGAGGGDSVVAFCADAEQERRLTQVWREMGVLPYPLKPDSGPRELL